MKDTSSYVLHAPKLDTETPKNPFLGKIGTVYPRPNALSGATFVVLTLIYKQQKEKTIHMTLITQ